MENSTGPIEITGKDSIWACTCMSSWLWPICDGSHHTYGGEGPEEVVLDPAKTYRLCQCFKTANRPFCDGSHLR
ncbi:MAG: CDGSH iron-sulfur domain-containing protein [Nitrospinae bacterium]|nr:CDGSH iron-sulfur domain-containing protein [Nitrospinota bacterium]